MSSTSAAIQIVEFTRALAMAWKNLAAYPRTHPAVTGSLAEAEKRLAELRGPAGEVVIGVGRDHLVYGSLTLDAAAARRLAEALYARGVAVLRLAGETKPEELETFLRLLAGGTGREKRPIWEELTAEGVMNINLQPVNYDNVQIDDDLEKKEEKQSDEELWEEILRSLLEGLHFSQTARGSRLDASVDELSRMLAEYVDEIEGPPEEFDPDGTFGVKVSKRDARLASIFAFVDTTFGERLRTTPIFGLQHSIEQAVQLLQLLPPGLRKVILAAILKALSADDANAQALQSLSNGLASNDVLEALRYLSSMGELSPHAALLLRALTGTPAASAAAPPPAPAAVADLVRLFGEQDVDRFNPPDHATLLETVSIRIPELQSGVDPVAVEQLGNRAATVGNAAVLRQLSAVVVDLLVGLPPGRPFDPLLERVETLFRTYLDSGEFEEPFSLLAQVQEVTEASANPALKAAVEEMVVRLGAGTTIQSLLESIHAASAEKIPALQRLIRTLGQPALRQLLTALADEGTLSRRRRLFDFIASLGAPVVPVATGFLADSRWYVVRNMITLLRVLEDRASLPEVRKLARHEDLRVRMEAIKTLFAIDGAVPARLLGDMFTDPDPKLAVGAIGMVGTYRMKEAVDPLLKLLEGRDLFGGARMIRVKAIRALGEIADPRALPVLGRFLKAPRWLPWPAREERLAAWESLARYPAPVRRPFVEQGLQSPDAEVRAICARLRS